MLAKVELPNLPLDFTFDTELSSTTQKQIRSSILLHIGPLNINMPQ